jgi:hypothetical protein
MLRFRRCINSANAIPPKMSRHSTANMTMLFVGIGRLSGNFILKIICFGDIRCFDLDQLF